MKPVGPTFHRSFPLQRVVLAAYLRALCEAGSALSPEQIREVTGLGTMKVPSALGYGKATGLLGTDGLPTPLGKWVFETDPDLTDSSTQWLLHAGLSGVSELAPAYWQSIWSQMGSQVDRESLLPAVSNAYEPGLINASSARVSVTAFVSTYTNDDGLAGLGLLRGGKVSVKGTNPSKVVPLGVFAFALASRWEALHPEQLTAGLEGFLRDSRLLDIFRLSRGEADGLLEGLARRGDVELYRTAPPHQIVRKWDSLADVVARIYEDAA